MEDFRLKKKKIGSLEELKKKKMFKYNEVINNLI